MSVILLSNTVRNYILNTFTVLHTHLKYTSVVSQPPATDFVVVVVVVKNWIVFWLLLRMWREKLQNTGEHFIIPNIVTRTKKHSLKVEILFYGKMFLEGTNV